MKKIRFFKKVLRMTKIQALVLMVLIVAIVVGLGLFFYIRGDSRLIDSRSEYVGRWLEVDGREFVKDGVSLSDQFEKIRPNIDGRVRLVLTKTLQDGFEVNTTDFGRMMGVSKKDDGIYIDISFSSKGMDFEGVSETVSYVVLGQIYGFSPRKSGELGQLAEAIEEYKDRYGVYPVRVRRWW